jgi:hypothetical protein
LIVIVRKHDEYVDRIRLAHDRNQRRVLVETVMGFLVAENAEDSFNQLRNY